ITDIRAEAREKIVSVDLMVEYIPREGHSGSLHVSIGRLVDEIILSSVVGMIDAPLLHITALISWHRSTQELLRREEVSASSSLPVKSQLSTPSPIEDHSDKEEDITPNCLPELEHILTRSESKTSVTSLPRELSMTIQLRP
ncbi:1839_t:CDS:2, partial [Ambispora gerdemannii]